MEENRQAVLRQLTGAQRQLNEGIAALRTIHPLMQDHPMQKELTKLSEKLGKITQELAHMRLV